MSFTPAPAGYGVQGGQPGYMTPSSHGASQPAYGGQAVVGAQQFSQPGMGYNGGLQQAAYGAQPVQYGGLSPRVGNGSYTPQPQAAAMALPQAMGQMQGAYQTGTPNVGYGQLPMATSMAVSSPAAGYGQPMASAMMPGMAQQPTGVPMASAMVPAMAQQQPNMMAAMAQQQPNMVAAMAQQQPNIAMLPTNPGVTQYPQGSPYAAYSATQGYDQQQQAVYGQQVVPQAGYEQNAVHYPTKVKKKKGLCC
eukprot:CAMPEP_0194488268 /NCGR_PEP_ID=MMETSP0253-20130528/8250_1 /TAXON_ID=2966 /ORGANISM="Noctiluca scintillans" /LENGTH=249 /DNA_ID=CAMNT_0039328605 /DNA_START=41 /DNA_END=790 /DNA_ORIENTATION=-